MNTLLWIDYIILGIVGVSTLISLIRGFVREALSLIGWIAAFFIASKFYIYLAAFFTGIEDIILRNATAIALLFCATLIVSGIVNHLIGKLVDKTGLSGTDRLLGMCFGAVRGILLMAAMLLFADAFTGLGTSEDWQNSQLIPKFKPIQHWFFDYLKTSSQLFSEYMNKPKI
ncbi:CvpA family protein [Thorsellia kenyensis]|uniref:CvpA family protein n=1 Tax=Thorsellia kenyensis TaxID=1549888 RepID=A0ABV6CAT1_9GAMM